MKPNLELSEVLANIENQVHFEAFLSDESVYIKIDDYVPFVCFAIHNGHQLREELASKCALSDFERWYEEDPFTFDFISSLPIVIAANDSRYEYDLNRNPKDAVYEQAWGKEVWNKTLSKSEKKRSLDKHQIFYQIVYAIIQKLEEVFSSVLVFDIHSYNYKRIESETPVFNVGTEKINRKKYQNHVAFWINQLGKIKLPSIDVQAKENDVFYGRGYLLEFINSNFNNSLVLATEIKKIYCDEESGESYPIVIETLTNQFKKAVVNTAAHFARKYTSLRVLKNNSLLSEDLDQNLINIDRKLFRIASDFEILNYVNPINVEQAKKEFIKSRFQKNPSFKYKQLSIDPFEFKRQLYSIKIENIKDISQRILYQDVIDSYADKIDIITSIGTEKFLYNSLRYFGEPGTEDVKNAEYLLHSSSDIDGKEELLLSSEDVKNYFSEVLKNYGFNCKIETSKKIISKVQVLNNRKIIRIRKDAMFSERALHALAEHEVGVHMLTTVNSRFQALNVFRLGTPLNTHTQEGLAILSEHLSGNLSVNRLHTLAIRVLAIKMMLNGLDFKQTYQFLMDSVQIDQNQAFYLAARIYRGGGFTKDYLYLKGFRDILNEYKVNTDLTYLLIGKTSLKYGNLIKELIERKLVVPPKYKTHSLINPVQPDPVIQYILNGIK